MTEAEEEGKEPERPPCIATHCVAGLGRYVGCILLLLLLNGWYLPSWDMWLWVHDQILISRALTIFACHFFQGPGPRCHCPHRGRHVPSRLGPIHSRAPSRRDQQSAAQIHWKLPPAVQRQMCYLLTRWPGIWRYWRRQRTKWMLDVWMEPVEWSSHGGSWWGVLRRDEGEDRNLSRSAKVGRVVFILPTIVCVVTVVFLFSFSFAISFAIFSAISSAISSAVFFTISFSWCFQGIGLADIVAVLIITSVLWVLGFFWSTWMWMTYWFCNLSY